MFAIKIHAYSLFQKSYFPQKNRGCNLTYLMTNMSRNANVDGKIRKYDLVLFSAPTLSTKVKQPFCIKHYKYNKTFIDIAGSKKSIQYQSYTTNYKLKLRLDKL